MKKITSDCPIFKIDADEKYIVSKEFIRYVSESGPQLNEKMFHHKHKKWNRVFYFSKSLATVTAVNVLDVISTIVCEFTDYTFTGRIDWYFQSARRPSYWLRRHILFEWNKDEGVLIQYPIEKAHEYENHKDDLVDEVIKLVQICFFMDVADVFTEIIPPKQKRKIHNCKYQNKTKHQLHFLTANYIKTSVRTEGFKVRGHFRWQPCGPNRSERKLIFVDSFEKSGYTIQAKKDTILSAHK